MHSDRKTQIKVIPIFTPSAQSPAQNLLWKSFHDHQSMIKLEGKQENKKSPDFSQAIQTSDGQSMCMEGIRGYGWGNGLQLKESEFRLELREKFPVREVKPWQKLDMIPKASSKPNHSMITWLPFILSNGGMSFQTSHNKTQSICLNIVLILFPLKTPLKAY